MMARSFHRLFRAAAAALIRRAQHRLPDFVVGGHADPYLKCWWLIPRNPLCNVYLHQFLRSDDDRALHDHPWFWCSIVLRGDYIEHTISAGGIHRNRMRAPGSVRIASPWLAHRVELFPWWLGALDVEQPRNAADMTEPAPCWTLFITGPRLRNWGFHCPERGWVPWQQFTAADDPGAIGKGCAP
jgi:hypothetical protein